MENLFDQSEEKPASDDTPMSILKQVQECYDYFYSPGMSVLVFESKFDRLKAKVDKEIESRKV